LTLRGKNHVLFVNRTRLLALQNATNASVIWALSQTPLGSLITTLSTPDPLVGYEEGHPSTDSTPQRLDHCAFVTPLYAVTNSALKSPAKNFWLPTSSSTQIEAHPQLFELCCAQIVRHI